MTKDGEEVGTRHVAGRARPGSARSRWRSSDTAAANDGEKVEAGGAVATVAPLSVFDPEKRRRV